MFYTHPALLVNANIWAIFQPIELNFLSTLLEDRQGCDIEVAQLVGIIVDVDESYQLDHRGKKIFWFKLFSHTLKNTLPPQ